MASAREDRMQSRMRGAGRHVVQDDSFGFVLPAADDLSPDSRAAANPPMAIESEPAVPEAPAPAATITRDVDTVLPDAPAAREGRMQSRMRGAGRHQVADDAFGLILPITAEEPPSEPADIILPDAGPTANTSAKRRRLNNGSPAGLGSSSSPGQLSSGGSRTSPRLRRNGGVAPAGASSVLVQRTAASLATTRGSNPLNSSATKALSQLSLLGHSAEETPGATAALAALTVQDHGSARAGDDVDEEMELPPATRPPTRKPNGTRAAALLRSSPTSDPMQRGEEVVAESPRDAPGSGRRQRIRQNLDDTTTQSARLQRAVMEAEGGFEPTTSSPLARKTRNSTAGAAAKQARSTGTGRPTKTAAQLSSSPGGGGDELVESDGGGGNDDDGGIVDPLSSDPVPLGTPGIGQSSSPSLHSSTRRTATAGAIRGSSSRNRTRNASSPLGSAGAESLVDGEVAGSSPTLETASKRPRSQPSKGTQQKGAAVATTTTANLGPKGRRRPPVVPDSPEQAATGRRAVAGPRQRTAEEQGGEREDPRQDDSIAEEIPDEAAAARLATKKNRKRPTAAPTAESPPQPPSPELNSEPPDSARPAKRQRDVTIHHQDDDDTAQQRRQKRAEERADEVGPARQAQSRADRTRAKAKPNKPAPAKPVRRKRRSSGGNADEDEGQAAGNDVIPIVVQRYTRPSAAALRRRRRDSLRHNGEGRGSDEDEDDILVLEGAEIPYADRSGVNAVDVLTQMCEEVIDATLEKMQQRATAAMEGNGGAGGPGNAVKKEMRTKMRALEAFQEELRTRLLEHTIALDSLHSLRKRVRAAQREKLNLRADILRIRAERQEVALKMDAVRIRHEQENAETLHQLALSSTLHDIELAVENGRSAALEDGYQEPSTAAAGSARMANLEISIGRMAEQAGGGFGGGGNLDKIREFNAMLERAAAVLEGR